MEKFAVTCQQCAAIVEFDLRDGVSATVRCEQCKSVVYSRSVEAVVTQAPRKARTNPSAPKRVKKDGERYVIPPAPLDDVLGPDGSCRPVVLTDAQRDKVEELLAW